MIVVAGTIPIKPEKREEAARACLKMVEATRKEQGCLTYTFFSDLGDPSLFHVFEEWESDEDLQRHFQTEHMKEFQQATREARAGGGQVKRYVVESSAPL